MIEYLNQIDTSVFLFLNGIHSDFFDKLMLIISYNKYLFIILITLLSIFGIKRLKKVYFIAFFFCLIGFGLSDSISTRVFKDGFKRLRPCHNQTLAKKVHLAGQNCWGGKFGFVSSHASNSFSIAMFFWLLFRKNSRKFILLFLYAGIVSYSRIYLAKHYPGDIIFGAGLGLLTGAFSYWLYTKALLYFLKQKTPNPL